jgi:hypothetical protein
LEDASADTSRSLIDGRRYQISSICFPIVRGVTLDVIGWWVVQLFHSCQDWQISIFTILVGKVSHHPIIARVPPLPLKIGQSNRLNILVGEEYVTRFLFARDRGLVNNRGNRRAAGVNSSRYPVKK